jgi:hypothetical protein
MFYEFILINFPNIFNGIIHLSLPLKSSIIIRNVGHQATLLYSVTPIQALIKILIKTEEVVKKNDSQVNTKK